MSNEEKFCYYGTPLPSLEIPEGTAPNKRHQPVRPEDQIVTDENGRRRFHGAFTGGFSAGYWNTVGSQEGWVPQSFKSSRNEKAQQQREQKPEDFMDDEDLGEHGIGSKALQVRSLYAHSITGTESDSIRKRKLMQTPSVGPIPGTPVLSDLLKCSNEIESVAIRILLNWGWRSGRGVGPRQSRKEQKAARQRNKRELYLVERYGSEAVPQAKKPIGYDDSADDAESDESDVDNSITYAPEDFEAFPVVNKNRYGLGYTPLSREPILSQSTYKRDPKTLEFINKNNKKFSITGQAFGVGALEEDDDMEVYQHEDLSAYDFSLQEELETTQTDKHKRQSREMITTALDGFHEAKQNFILNIPIQTVEAPVDFRPRNWGERRSRFAPLPQNKARELERNFEGCNLQATLTPVVRGRLLGQPEDTAARENTGECSDKGVKLLERIASGVSNFTPGGLITPDGQVELLPQLMEKSVVHAEHKQLLEKPQGKTKLDTISVSDNFKPFVADEAKQKRYEKFLLANLQTEHQIISFLESIQPIHLSNYDRVKEKKEFIQARHMYKPLRGIMSERFVTETSIIADNSVKVNDKQNIDKKKVVKRTTSIWKPSVTLCKRYNVAEPFAGAFIEEEKPLKAKLSIFDYLETSVNKKSDFQTPVIIPKLMENPKAIVCDKQSEKPNLIDISEKNPIKPIGNFACLVNEYDIQRNEKDRFVGRTKLEKRVIESMDKLPSEKLELFQAIFDNDSDDDLPAKSVSAVTSSEGPVGTTVNATAANILRNTSPPRGIFAALFAPESCSEEKRHPNITQSKSVMTTPETKDNLVLEKNVDILQHKITFKPRNERLSQGKNDNRISEDFYGPKLPTLLGENTVTSKVMAAESSSTKDLEVKIAELLTKQKQRCSLRTFVETDKWVEKGSIEETRSDSMDSCSSSSSSSVDKKKAARKMKKSKKVKERRSGKKHTKIKDKIKSNKKHGKKRKHKKIM